LRPQAVSSDCAAQRANRPVELDAACGIGVGVLLGTTTWAAIVAIGVAARESL